MFLKGRGRLDGYPLFEKVYKISFEGLDPKSMVSTLASLCPPSFTFANPCPCSVQFEDL